MSRRLILVTGATGGLGMAVVRELRARGHRVRATGRSLSAGQTIRDLGAQFVAADLTTTDAGELVDGVGSVIHAAALSASWGPRADFEAANVAATERLLTASRAGGVRRFVFISSPSIFAAFRDRAGIGAGDPPAVALNDYARTKLQAERLVLAAPRDSFARCVIRPRALVGPGDRVILPRLAALARRPRMPLPRGGRALIELTDLRDAARAIADAEDRAEAIDGAAINISGAGPIAVHDLAAGLAAAMGRTPELVAVPIAVARPLAMALEALAKLARSPSEPVLTRYTLATLAYTQTFDQEPARRLLGYGPQYDATATLLSEARRLADAEPRA